MLYKIHQNELYKEKHPMKHKNINNYNQRFLLCLGIIVYAIGTFIFLTIGYTLKQYFLPEHHPVQLNSFVEP
jgi:hypothetical protein